MSIVQVLDGDLITMFKEGKFEGIAHGCNCHHLMGAGIAAGISGAFPQAYAADLKTAMGDINKLGLMSTCNVLPYGRIFNLYTQFYPGKEARTRLYEAIHRAFHAVNELMPEGYHLGIPQIGCGIAGGSWSDVSRIINESAPKLNITLVNYVPSK